GLEAKQISIDFFRLLRLEIDNIAFRRYEAWRDEPAGGARQKVTALSAENVRLKVLDWSPIPQNGNLQFILGERKKDDEPQRKVVGALGFADLRHVKLGPLDLHWLLIAHNFAPDKKVLDYLVENKEPA